MTQQRFEVQETVAETHPIQNDPQRLPVAYLAILDPKLFNNHLFWSRIYKTNQNESVLSALKGIDKDHLTRLYQYDGDTTFFPDLINVLQRLKHICGIKNIILDCCIDAKMKKGLATELDFVLASKTKVQPNFHNNNGDHSNTGDNNDGNNNDNNSPPPPPFTPNNIIGYPNGGQPAVQQTGSASCFLKILGGFMMALGAAAIIAAFAVLNAATLGLAGTTVAIAGAVTGLIGYSLFKKGCAQNNQLNPIIAIP